MRLLAISRLWPQACTKMPPPPWELFVTDKPSMRDGLHRKLLGYGLVALLPLPLRQSLVVSSTVPKGIWLSVAIAPVSAPLPKTSTPLGNFTPFDRTVIPAPSSAPV